MHERINWPGVVLIAICVGGTLVSAPAPKAASPDTLCGKIDHAGPTVEVVTEEAIVRVWLVFPSQAIEQESRKIENGQPVKFHGRAMAGGTWRYFVVESIDKGD